MNEIVSESTLRFITTSEKIAREDESYDALIDEEERKDPDVDDFGTNMQNISHFCDKRSTELENDESVTTKANSPITCSVIVDKIEQERRKIYTREIQGVALNDSTSEIAVVKVPKQVHQSDHLGINPKHHTINSCNVEMQSSLYDYLIDSSDLKVPFDPPIDAENLPSNFVPIKFSDKTFVEVKQNVTMENKVDNDKSKPQWWDQSRQFPVELNEAEYYLTLKNDIETVKGIAKIEGFTKRACELLTETCFTYKHLSRLQILVSFLALSGLSYRKICDVIYKTNKEWNINKSQVPTILARTFTGNYFNTGVSCGKMPSLGFIDSLILITEIDLEIVHDTPPHVSWVTDRAKALRTARIEKAKEYYETVYGLEHKIVAPWNSVFEGRNPSFDSDWVYKFTKKAGFVNRTGEPIERARGVNCTAVTLIRWSLQFGKILESYNNKGRWIFNFDEAMISLGNHNNRFITRRGKDKPTYSIDKEKEHITIGCCFNQKGAGPPLFIILNKLAKLAADFREKQGLEVNFVSSTNGWMDKVLFYEWSKMFCKWLEEYREKLHESGEVILLLDSHNSRSSLDALNVLKACNVRVITFPPHCTHALQPFDAVIAHSLKTRYAKLFREYSGGGKTELSLQDYRTIAIDAILQAWKEVLNPFSAHKAFEATGMCPFSTGIMLMARGVNTLSQKDPEKEDRKCTNRLVISSCELTSEANMKRISEYYEKTETKKRENTKKNEKTKEEQKAKNGKKKDSLTFSVIREEEILERHKKNYKLFNSKVSGSIKGIPVMRKILK